MRSRAPRSTLTVVATLHITLLSACNLFVVDLDSAEPIDEEPPGVPCLVGQDMCRRNIDCRAGSLCVKEEGATTEDEGCCVPAACATDEDCFGADRCATDIDLCLPVEGCDVHAADACPDGETCVVDDSVARCVPDAFLPDLARCHVEPRRVVLVEGGAHPLVVVQRDVSGLPIRAHRVPIAASSTGAVVHDEVGGRVVALPCESAPCVDTLVASVAGVQCAMEVVVVDELAVAEGRVSLQDARTGAALVNALVVARFDDALLTRLTDAHGLARFDRSLVDAVAVTAQPSGHAWVTIVAPGQADIALFVDEAAAGTSAMKGRIDTSGSYAVGDISTGYATLAPRAPLVDVEWESIFGPLIVRTVRIEGVADDTQVAFPLGQTMAVGVEPVKSHFVTTPASIDDLVSVVGGKLRIDDVATLVIGNDDGDDALLIDIMTSMLFERMNLALLGNVETAPIDPALLTDVSTVDGELNVPEVTVTPTIAPTWRVDVDTPVLPCLEGTTCGAGAHVEAALVVVGVRVPGAGFVPLALKAEFDATVDDNAVQGARDGLIGMPLGPVGRVSVRGAPPPFGLADFPVTVVVAARTSGVLFPDADTPVYNVRAPMEDPSSSVGFSSLGYAPVAPVTRADETLVVALEGAPIDAVRVHFESEDGAWDIYTATSTTIDLGSLVVGAPRSGEARATAMRLRVGADPAPLGALVSRSAWNLDRIEDATEAWTTSTVE